MHECAVVPRFAHCEFSSESQSGVDGSRVPAARLAAQLAEVPLTSGMSTWSTTRAIPWRSSSVPRLQPPHVG